MNKTKEELETVIMITEDPNVSRLPVLSFEFGY
jgi:hypothetical protein